MFTYDDKLSIQLYIDTGDKEQNKAAFDQLKQQKDEIEQAFGGELSWERLDEKQACRISVYRAARVTDSSTQLEQTKQWAVETGLRFIDALQPRIRKLRTK